MLGGVFNTLVAPLLFTGIFEYPIVLVLACVARPSPGYRRGDSSPGGCSPPAASVPATALAGLWATGRTPPGVNLGAALLVAAILPAALSAGANRRAPFNALAALAVAGLILTSGARSDSRGRDSLPGGASSASRACWRPTTTRTGCCSMGRRCTGDRICRRIRCASRVVLRRARAGGRRLRAVRPAFRGRRDRRARQRRARLLRRSGKPLDVLRNRPPHRAHRTGPAALHVPLERSCSASESRLVTDASCWKLRHLILSTPSSWTPSAPTRFRPIC